MTTVYEDGLVTSHSIDGTFENCPRRFEFTHAYLMLPEYESHAFAADVGTAEHEAVQAWCRAKHSSDSLERERAYQKGMLALLKYWPWKEEALIESAEFRSVGSRTLGNAVLLYEKIIQNKLWDEWELVNIVNFGAAIEVPYRIIHKSLGKVHTPHGDKYIVSQGKLDFILRHRVTGRYRMLDLKTTEKSKPAHDASFRFSGQGGLYGLVLAHALGLDWQHEGLEITYLVAWFTPEGPEVYPLNYKLNPEEVQDMIDVKMDRLYRMQAYANARHYPRRAHGCEMYNRPCGFLDICERRDEKFIKEWFEFEIAKGTFKPYDRVYEPVWTLEA